MTQKEYNFREARPDEAEKLVAFDLEHGKSRYRKELPPEVLQQETRRWIERVQEGSVTVIIAETRDEVAELVGMVVLERGDFMARHMPPDRPDKRHGYVGGLVVHQQHREKKLGVELATLGRQKLFEEGYDHVFTHRHEKNEATRRIWLKTNTVEIASYDDPKNREPVDGSTNTVVGLSRRSQQSPP